MFSLSPGLKRQGWTRAKEKWREERSGENNEITEAKKLRKNQGNNKEREEQMVS